MCLLPRFLSSTKAHAACAGRCHAGEGKVPRCPVPARLPYCTRTCRCIGRRLARGCRAQASRATKQEATTYRGGRHGREPGTGRQDRPGVCAQALANLKQMRQAPAETAMACSLCISHTPDAASSPSPIPSRFFRPTSSPSPSPPPIHSRAEAGPPLYFQRFEPPLVSLHSFTPQRCFCPTTNARARPGCRCPPLLPLSPLAVRV